MLSKTIATKNGGPNYAIKNYIIQVPVIAKTISLPEKGTQKIIDPDGTVTIENTSSGVQNNLNEIDMLNQRIQYLERIVSGHEATIKSLETTIKSKDDLICILRSSLDKQD